MRDFDAKRNAFGGGARPPQRARGRALRWMSWCRVRVCVQLNARAQRPGTSRIGGGWDSARNLGRNAWAKRGGEAVFFGKDFRFGTNEDVTSKLRLPLRVDDTLVARGTRRLTGSYRNEAVLAWKTEQPLRGV